MGLAPRALPERVTSDPSEGGRGERGRGPRDVEVRRKDYI